MQKFESRRKAGTGTRTVRRALLALLVVAASSAAVTSTASADCGFSAGDWVWTADGHYGYGTGTIKEDPNDECSPYYEWECEVTVEFYGFVDAENPGTGTQEAPETPPDGTPTPPESEGSTPAIDWTTDDQCSDEGATGTQTETHSVKGRETIKRGRYTVVVHVISRKDKRVIAVKKYQVKPARPAAKVPAKPLASQPIKATKQLPLVADKSLGIKDRVQVKAKVFAGK